MLQAMPTKIDMYNASVPALLRTLSNLDAILDKAAIFCAEKSIKEETLLGARLALDMFPFSRQVQIVADNAKGAAARLGGVEVPSYEDTETTIADLKARLAKTADFVKSVPAAGFEGAETRDIVLTFGTKSFPFVGFGYLNGFVLPNVNFHFSMAYAILRHHGMSLGKLDYMGA